MPSSLVWGSSLFFFQTASGWLVYNIPGVVTVKYELQKGPDREMEGKSESWTFLDWDWEAALARSYVLRCHVAGTSDPGEAAGSASSRFLLGTEEFFLTAVINQTSTGSTEIIEMKHELWNVLPEMISVLSSVVSPFASAKEMSFQEDAWIGDVKITCFSWEF